MENRYYSDEELVAFLDREEEFAPVHEIERALPTDHVLAARVKALSLDKNSIQNGLDSLLNVTHTPLGLPRAVESQQSGSRTYGFQSVAAVALIALTIGIVGTISTINRNEPDWRDFVASYQALYSNATLAHINQSPEAMASELTRVSETIAKPIKLSSITNLQSVTYKRAQVLSFKGRPLIQLAFLSRIGAPIALCIIRSQAKGSEVVSALEMQGMSASTWTKNGVEYLLIGGKDQSMISDLAKYFAKTI